LGYWFGSKVDYLYNKQDSFGSKENIGSVKDFFEKYGGKALFRSFSSNFRTFAL
jgi:hypothetical protein